MPLTGKMFGVVKVNRSEYLMFQECRSLEHDYKFVSLDCALIILIKFRQYFYIVIIVIHLK